MKLIDRFFMLYKDNRLWNNPGNSWRMTIDHSFKTYIFYIFRDIKN